MKPCLSPEEFEWFSSQVLSAPQTKGKKKTPIQSALNSYLNTLDVNDFANTIGVFYKKWKAHQ